MRVITLVCLFAVSALALPTRKYNSNTDTAICVFSLLSVQKRGGDPTNMLKDISPYLSREKKLDNNARQLLLIAGGLTSAQAEKMLNEILPILAGEGKSPYEQLMAIMFMADRVCADGERCNGDDYTLFPFLTMGEERGCIADEIKANYRVSSDDKCVCNDQDNVLLWIALLDEIQEAARTGNKSAITQHLPNQLPVILMMLMAETPCDGTIQGTNRRCQCERVTEGNDGILMQYMVNAPGGQEILTESAKVKVQQYSREPTTRAGNANLMQMMMLQGNVNPMYLPFLTGGASSSQKMMQLLAANMGLDPATTQLLLNGGFNKDGNKVALINYMANKGVVSPDAVPFVLGVDKGSTFFLQSMIQSGAIDPVMGNLLLAKQTGASQGEVFELITQLLSGKKTDLKDFGKPFIPSLPSGIFPGMKLFFQHFERLGINTCSLHDLRNRFNCGYDGISAAQCEVLPYCCYNPVFLTDNEVRDMTDDAITSAAAVPWCYYNVFFIYYESFSLSVKRPGEFARPASCLPLFKYGLNIDASIYYSFAKDKSSSSINSLINMREECGFPGITEFHCVAIRGCCWDAYASYKVPQCFKPNGASSDISDLNDIPLAYQPKNQTCSVNYYQFPILYYRRIACMPTFDMFTKGRDPLKIPDKYECLWDLGCCYEENDEVSKKFDYVPRCYKREDGGYSVQANVIGQLSALITRSGSINIDTKKFPGANQP
ncbi:uncharacterized protein LOC120341815 [Styela clava]